MVGESAMVLVVAATGDHDMDAPAGIGAVKVNEPPGQICMVELVMAADGVITTVIDATAELVQELAAVPVTV